MFHSIHLSIGTGPCAKKKKKDMRGTDRLATVVLCAIITERNHRKQYLKYRLHYDDALRIGEKTLPR